MKHVLTVALVAFSLTGCAVYETAPYPYSYPYYSYGYGPACCYGPVYAYPAPPPVYGSFGVFLGGGGHSHWHHG
ncbi:MAG TPA: hypothetical protein VL974_15265 [Magnetospirillum sp.]|jgi:hypothetical protein|nr:hypothetical protein [Magnetospirillum sp.]